MDSADTTTKDRKTLSEYFERVWGQALVAVSTVEEEANKITSRVAEVAGWSQDEARKYVRELSERLAHQRKAMEQNVEDGVKRALGRVRIPRREELSELQARLERISQRIDTLSENR